MSTLGKAILNRIRPCFIIFAFALGDGSVNGDILSSDARPASLRIIGGSLMLIGMTLWTAKTRMEHNRAGLTPMFGLLLSTSGALEIIGALVLIFSGEMFSGLQIGLAVAASAFGIGLLAMLISPPEKAEKYDYPWFAPEFDTERDAYSGGHTVPTAGYMLDDLTKIDGIDETIQKLLTEAGIRYYNRLADTSPEELAVILSEGGLADVNYGSWPDQARLADNGEWAALQKLNEMLAAQEAAQAEAA